MANDNRKPPHRHDPELARKEALQARQTHTHRSGQKESGHRQTTSRVNKRPSTHSSATSRRKNIKKNSRYQQVRRQKMMLAGGGFLILLLVIIFSARSCISSRKAAEAAAIQKAQEAAQAKKSEETAKAAQKDPVSLTISVVGDCTLGTDSDTREDKTFAFKAPAEYAQILTSGSIEAVNTANNHSHDYGEQSYTDTLTALDNAGIIHFGYDDTAVMDIKGVKVGLVGIYELKDHLGREQQLKDNIAKVKADGAELVIVIFHWGNESETVPDTNQMTLGRLAIDEGADLVCGHHPHVLQGIETYKGKNIVYSLGNFCFGGNSSPSDIDTMIFQQTFTITSDGVQADNVTNIIPCSISSADGYNNYQPTPATGDEATRIKSKIDERSAAIPTADSTAKSSGDTGSSDTVSADDASGSTDTSDESESDTDSDFSDESDGSDYDTSEDYDTSDEEDYSSDEEADFSDNSDE